jgi:hypothetical protein
MVITRYRTKPHPSDPRRTILLVVGDNKHDVTDQFQSVAKDFARWQRRERRRKGVAP